MTAQIRILIVDDDPQFRQLVKLVLRRADDFDFVGEADDGATGIEQTEKLQPDVVLLDLMMPGIDGFEALPRIRAVHPGASVIVLTALDEDQVEEGILVGAANFVEKRHITHHLETVIRSCATQTT